MAVYQPKTVQADDELSTLRAELEREQERLRKLWDAFRSQEDELATLRSGAPAGPASGAGSESLRREVDLLTGDLRRAAEGQRRLEDENQVLRADAKDHAEVGRRVVRLESDLAEERERLAKLYVVYEEVDAARKKLESRLKEWEAWFHGASPHIQELARSVEGAPRGH